MSVFCFLIGIILMRNFIYLSNEFCDSQQLKFICYGISGLILGQSLWIFLMRIILEEHLLLQVESEPCVLDASFENRIFTGLASNSQF